MIMFIRPGVPRRTLSWDGAAKCAGRRDAVPKEKRKPECPCCHVSLEVQLLRHFSYYSATTPISAAVSGRGTRRARL